MATKKQMDESFVDNEDKIIKTPVEEIMGDRYAVYAKYVIQDRAIPDVRDGLKPVQRRILYAMYLDKNLSNRPTRKCAHTVGAVMGKFHPHGDSSIYNALARMAQDWKVRVPLIDFQGNKGSIDGDNPAAYRYTEARLSEAAEDLIRDFDKNTVDMQLTFDDTQLEPIVLPARFPNLLVNGAEGIAVAVATNIPPHNLVEVNDAVIYRIQHKKCSIDELLDIVKGPDFPTGGIIYNCEGLKSMYTSGVGRVEVASRTHIDTSNKNFNQIIVDQIPYDVVKSEIVFEIDKIRHDKIIDGIIEVRDESDREGLRIAIDIKKDSNPELILTYLMNKTQLKSSFCANMVAIVNNRPKQFSLIDYVDAYIAHQVDVITRRAKFDLEKYHARLHIVEGLIHAISIVDQVVAAIRASKDKADAKVNIQNKFGFTEIQSEAIVTLQLYKLSNTDINIFINEKNELEKNIAELEGILSDSHKLDRVIIEDLKAISKKYGTPRLTSIEEKGAAIQIDKRDLISKEEVMISISRDGYVKRSSMKSFKSSADSLPGLKDGDSLVGTCKAMTTDFLLLFTSGGSYCFVPVHEILDTKWKDEGKHINYICSLSSEEKVIKGIVVSHFRDDLFVAVLTRNGQIKRTKLNEFELQRYTKPVSCTKILHDDYVVDVQLTSGNSDLLILTEDGGATLFNENDLTPIGVKAAGVKAVQNLKLGKVVGMLVYAPEEKGKVFMLTNHGCERTAELGYVTKTPRLSKLQYVFKSFKSDPHKLVYFTKAPKGNDELNMICHMDDNSVFNLSIKDFYVTPVDKYAKQNIESMPNKREIAAVYARDIDLVDENTKSFYEPQNDNNHNPGNGGNTDSGEEGNSAESFEQISIFDNMGD